MAGLFAVHDWLLGWVEKKKGEKIKKKKQQQQSLRELIPSDLEGSGGRRSLAPRAVIGPALVS